MADLSLIKKLREATGCGIADCNKALAENGDDFEKSVDWLRKKGLSSAAKKVGRITAEGLAAVFVDNNKAGIIEVNSEKNDVKIVTKKSQKGPKVEIKKTESTKK